ncbi:hypothetical protein [Bacillus sp. FJAT-49736]|uniref:hypothetical protein n=1 Tax=Bacillus sp. FJAT-49736 TaxID=2833582 RepID=UPI001BC9E422|nr:hypothetical protein [Bacillus sp. FJAT-49736]MBS4172297.1 hypothetical protein [Bacillus sp. FJAT-49736]
MSEREQNTTFSEELGSELGDINATKFLELSQAAKKDDKKQDNKKRNNNAK